MCSGHLRSVNVRATQLSRAGKRPFSQSGPKQESLKVNVVQIPFASRLPWMSAGMAAALAGAGILAVQKQRWDQETQQKKIAEDAELQAKKHAEVAALAQEEAAKAAAERLARAAAQEQAERQQKAENAAREAKEAEDRLRAAQTKQASLANIAGQCSQLLADLKLVSEATDYVEASQHTEELTEFLRQAQGLVNGEAFKSLQDSSLDGMAELTGQCSYALSLAKEHLAKLSRAQAAEKQYQAAAGEMRAERKKWLLGKAVDTTALEGALSRAQEALSELRASGLDLGMAGVDGGQISSAESVLSQINLLEQKEQSWEQHRQVLQTAVASQDAAACEEALRKSSTEGCPPSAASTVAKEMLSLPQRSHQVQIKKSMQELASALFNNAEFGMHIAAATDASNALSSSSDLVDQACFLAEALAVQYMLEKQELLYSWQSLLPEWERQHAEDVARLSAEFDELKSGQKLKVAQDVQQAAAGRCAEAVREAAVEVQEEAEQEVYNLQSSHMQNLWTELAEVRQRLDSQLQALQQTPAHLRQLWSSGRNPDTQAESVSSSTLNLLALREGCKEQVMDGKDGFSKKLIGRLEEELRGLGQDNMAGVLTKQELQRNFHAQLPRLLAAVFEPREGLASGLVGRVFGKMYMLKGEEVEASLHASLESRLGQSIPSSQHYEEHEKHHQKHNLRALAVALQLVDNGKLQEAIDTMDGSLCGRCRSQASTWMSLARASLLLQQASDVLLARSVCLAASLSNV